MSGFNDLGRALRDDAEVNAPRASAIDVDAVAHAARARRRPRQWAVGTLSVVATLGIGGLALQSVTPPALIAASESADTATVESSGGSELLSEPAAPEALGDGSRQLTLLACGAAVPEPYSSSALTLLVQVPFSARGTDREFAGVAVLTNSGTEPITISTRVAAVGVLALEGVIVGESLAADDALQTIELAPGDGLELPLRVSTTVCDTGASVQAGGASVVVALEVSVASTGESFVLVASPATVGLN
jgi:hypothetical protein